MVRRRWLATVGALLVLGALLFPLHALVLGTPSPDALTTSGPAYQGLRTLETAGIGAGVLDPIEVLATPRSAALLAGQLSRVDRVRGAVAPASTAWRQHGSALVDVLARGRQYVGRGAGHP